MAKYARKSSNATKNSEKTQRLSLGDELLELLAKIRYAQWPKECRTEIDAFCSDTTNSWMNLLGKLDFMPIPAQHDGPMVPRTFELLGKIEQRVLNSPQIEAFNRYYKQGVNRKNSQLKSVASGQRNSDERWELIAKTCRQLLKDDEDLNYPSEYSKLVSEAFRILNPKTNITGEHPGFSPTTIRRAFTKETFLQSIPKKHL